MKYLISAVIGIILGYLLATLLAGPCPPSGTIGTPPAEWNSMNAMITTPVSDSAKYVSVSKTGTKYSVQIRAEGGSALLAGVPEGTSTTTMVYTLPPPPTGILNYKIKILCEGAMFGSPELTPALYWTFTHSGMKFEHYIFRADANNSLTITVVEEDM